MQLPLFANNSANSFAFDNMTITPTKSNISTEPTNFLVFGLKTGTEVNELEANFFNANGIVFAVSIVKTSLGNVPFKKKKKKIN